MGKHREGRLALEGWAWSVPPCRLQPAPYSHPLEARWWLPPPLDPLTLMIRCIHLAIWPIRAADRLWTHSRRTSPHTDRLGQRCMTLTGIPLSRRSLATQILHRSDDPPRRIWPPSSPAAGRGKGGGLHPRYCPGEPCRVTTHHATRVQTVSRRSMRPRQRSVSASKRGGRRQIDAAGDCVRLAGNRRELAGAFTA